MISFPKQSFFGSFCSEEGFDPGRAMQIDAVKTEKVGPDIAAADSSQVENAGSR